MDVKEIEDLYVHMLVGINLRMNREPVKVFQ